MMRFEGKVAIVTGAGQGIGEQYALALAREGAAVVVADINEVSGERVTATIKAAGGRALFVAADVASESSGAHLAAATISEFGGVDYLVNNAAIYAGMKMEKLLTVDLAYYRRFMEVNMHGALVMTRAVYQHMAQRGGGAIVNQSSTAAYMGGNYYGVAKLGLNALTVGLAGELGPLKIRVNGIAPGPTDTFATQSTVPKEIIAGLVSKLPLARMGQTQDIVGACLFLLSDEAGWITGQTLCVDGGQIRRA
jgi:NAD(P)-dependent dehydrogenase (short-subunit alcohol dehydrogenase family)